MEKLETPFPLSNYRFNLKIPAPKTLQRRGDPWRSRGTSGLTPRARGTNIRRARREMTAVWFKEV